MRSKAHYDGHPIHPALIPFPFAFLVGAFAFHLAGLLLNSASLSTTGSHLAIAGIGMGLIAAVPGIIDYVYRVPPKSTGKTRAGRHGLLNAGAIVLFALSWWLRAGTDATLLWPLMLEGVAVVMLVIAGWMGGTLVNRNQIGVDHRYADAGKWKEVTVAARPGEPVTVATTDELKENQIKLLHVNGRRIALTRTNSGFAAFDDRCPHRGASLADGMTACGVVQCPWHGSQFDVSTGQVRAGPATDSITTYTVEEHNGEVRLTI
jgi:nitrite reductase/ring-hydroxylating ferredoxin subunit/uncharacterized membrane protein